MFQQHKDYILRPIENLDLTLFHHYEGFRLRTQNLLDSDQFILHTFFKFMTQVFSGRVFIKTVQ